MKNVNDFNRRIGHAIEDQIVAVDAAPYAVVLAVLNYRVSLWPQPNLKTGFTEFAYE